MGGWEHSILPQDAARTAPTGWRYYTRSRGRAGRAALAACRVGSPVADRVGHDGSMQQMPVPSADDAARTMARVCGDREQAWSLLSRLTRADDPTGWATRLETDIAELRATVSWLDPEWRPDGLLLLEGLVRRGRRRGVDDLAELAEDAAVAAQPHLSRMARHTAAVQAMVAEELGAWQRGDVPAAKTVRVEQMGLVGKAAEIREPVEALATARMPVWSPVAQVVAAYLLLETGH